MTVVIDDFNRADGGLGASWTAHTSGPPAISADGVVGVTSASGSTWTGDDFTSDQSSRVNIITAPSSGDWVGVTARAQSGNDFYLAVSFNNAGTNVLRLYKCVAGTLTQLGSDVTQAVVAADNIGLEAVGSTIRVRFNGFIKIEVTDTTFTGGRPGIRFQGTTGKVDYWNGNSIVTDPVTMYYAGAEFPHQFNTSAGYNLGTMFQVLRTGMACTGVQFFRPHSVTGAITVALYHWVGGSPGSAVATAVAPALTTTHTVGEFQDALFTTPVALTNGEYYIATAEWPNGVQNPITNGQVPVRVPLLGGVSVPPHDPIAITEVSPWTHYGGPPETTPPNGGSSSDDCYAGPILTVPATVLDAFGRADGDVGAAWGSPVTQASGVARPDINGHAVRQPSATEVQGYWLASTFSADQFAEAIVSAVPTSSGHSVYLMLCIADPGAATAITDCYLFAFIPADSTVYIYKESNSSFSTLTNGPATVTAGATVRVEKTSAGVLRVLVNGSVVLTTTDGSPLPGGYIGLGLNDSTTNGRLDEFNGGDLVSGGPSYSTTGTGTLTLTGSATSTITTSPSYTTSGTGTLTLTGSAVSAALLTETHTGVLLVSGSATTTITLTETGAGTFTLTGHATSTLTTDGLVPSALEIMRALASQIDGVLAPLLPTLQVVGGMMWSPTPPCIDIYPDDPFEELIAFNGAKTLHLIIRARVDTPDRAGAQELLLSMMDSSLPTSVEGAILSDDTIGGRVSQVAVDTGPSDYGAFADPAGSALLGSTWRVQVVTK